MLQSEMIETVQRRVLMPMNSTLLALAWFGLVSPMLPIRIAQAEDIPILSPMPAEDPGSADELLSPLPAEDSGSTDQGSTDELEMPAGEFLEEANSPVAPTTNYSDERISVDYPVSWQIVAGQDNSVQILDGTQGSADEVVTEIFVIDSPPGVLINANIDSFITEGSVVGPYGQVMIDDQQAFTIWLAERPMALSRAIATFIGYDDQTVLLFSSFTPENEAVEERLLELHSSFKKVAEAELAPELSLENEPI